MINKRIRGHYSFLFGYYQGLLFNTIQNILNMDEKELDALHRKIVMQNAEAKKNGTKGKTKREN